MSKEHTHMDSDARVGGSADFGAGTPGHGLASGRDRRSVEPAGMLRQIGSASDGSVGRMALVADPRASGEAGSEDLLRSSQGGDHGMELDLDGCSRGNPPPAVRDKK